MVDFRYADPYGLAELRRLMQLLRSPEGCPWDREQTHASIRRNMIEEAYEAAEAIDEGDPDHLKEELGDVLLQVVFHSCMAQEAGLFTLDDVIDGVCKKLLFRHPHVFHSVQAADAESALAAWETQKREEKGQKTTGGSLDAVARSLPALIRAEKIQGKAHKAGFDWPDAQAALCKVDEELEELRRAASGDGDPAEELGDLLFAAVKAGRFLGVESEEALHSACEKFISRFCTVETLAGDRPLTSMTTGELEGLWAQAKIQKT